MVSEDHPEIVDSVLEGIELLSGDGELFLLDSGKFLFFKFHELMKGVDFGFLVFEEGHDEGFGVEEVDHVVKVPSQMFQVNRDDGRHVVQLKSLFLVCFQTVFLENV